MAKSQKRSNREARKPKADKPKTQPEPAANSNLAMLAGINGPKRKK